MAATFLPWETSRWLARYALEEHYADSIAAVVLSVWGSVTLEDGTTRPLAVGDFAECAEPFVAAVDDTFTTIVTTIHDYRLGRLDLDAMWLAVQTNTGEVLIALAHAQAERDQQSEDDAESVAALLAAPLASLWNTMRECRNVPLFDGPEEFARQEQAAIDRAGAAIIDFWRRLGLTFRPEGDTFYINVAGPDEAWPSQTL